jgi:hypothetical protein
MLELLRAHGRVYELVPSGQAPRMARVPALRGAQPKALRFGTLPEALRFVRDLVARDAGRLHHLRRAVQARDLASDDEVIEALARALVTARLIVHEQPEPRPVIHHRRAEVVEERGVLAAEEIDFIDGAIEAAAPPDELEPSIAGQMEPDELEPYLGEEPLPQREVDFRVAQAGVLREAAQNGAPFCEECEKAKQELLAEEPADEVAHVDAAAQAQAMRDAAAKGTPFCEECEKAKKKQQQQQGSA